ncbi:hypothetical protein N333_06569, partial [Nestor notabilis]
QCTSNCNSQVKKWNIAERVMVSLFAPQVGVAKALGNTDKLSCLVAKQNNLTSALVSELALDLGSIRCATLQNRAAIDFLLLAQGHGCEEFEGMCCMNLSDHSESIH